MHASQCAVLAHHHRIANRCNTTPFPSVCTSSAHPITSKHTILPIIHPILPILLLGKAYRMKKRRWHTALHVAMHILSLALADDCTCCMWGGGFVPPSSLHHFPECMCVMCCLCMLQQRNLSRKSACVKRPVCTSCGVSASSHSL